MKHILLTLCLFALVGPAVAQKAPATVENPRLTAFTNLLTRAQRSADGLSSDDMLKLLDEGRDMGRPHPVAGVARGYLSRHPDPAPRILRLAAQNAMLTGDFRLAVSRYKQFFRKAPVNEDSSTAAAELFCILTDYIKQAEDAFAANIEYGDKYRQSAQVKQYDDWFLGRCWDTRATGAMAQRLATIFAEKLPLPQERFGYWHHLDRLIERLASVYPGNADAILPGRVLVPLIREDNVRAARLSFFLDNIAFHENRAGKTPTVLANDFKPVLISARAYLESAPTEQTLRHIMAAFGGGTERPDAAVWSTLTDEKQAFFTTYAFTKLPEAEQITFLNWNWWAMPNCLATSEQWITLGGKAPKAFQKAAGTARLPLLTQTTNAALYKAQAAFLTGLTFDAAAAINAMAGANNVDDAIQHLLTQASWAMSFNDRSRNNVETFPDLVFNQIIPAWANLKVPAAGAERDAFSYESQLSFMEKTLFSSVMTPFSHTFVRHGLRNVWGYCSQEAARRDRYIALLGKLAWVPFVNEAREKVFEPAQNEFTRWAQETRRQFDSLAGKADEASVKRRQELGAAVKQVAQIEEAFKTVIASKPGTAAAPDQRCSEVVALLKAVGDKDAAAYAAAAKPLYAAVREYEKAKTPWGEALLELLMTPRDDALAASDQQLEILADQLALRLITPAHTRGAQACVRQIVSRQGWRQDWTIRPRNEDGALRDALASVLAKAINARTAKDLWDHELFTWYRGVVRQDTEEAQAVVAGIIDRDIFTKHGVSNMWHTSPTCGSLALIRNEFPSLRTKYPLETWFDDRMAAEITRTGFVDPAYWSYGQDRLKKVANALAELFTADISYDAFVGTPTTPAKYTRDQFWTLSWRILNADAQLVNAYLDKTQAAFGQTRFDGSAAGYRSLSTQPADTKEQRAVFFDSLRDYTTHAKAMPYYLGLPAIPQLNTLQLGGTAPLTEAELTVLANFFRYCRWTGWTGTEERLMLLINSGLSSRERYGELLPLIPEMWRIAFEQNRRETMLLLAGFTSELMEANQAIAAGVYSVSGLEIAAARLPEDIRNSLTAMRTKSQSQAGGSLLVERSDRRYPILAAQALFHAGRLDSAWEHYLQAPKLALSEFKELDLGFSIWLVDRHILLAQFDQADNLARTLIQWIDAAPQGFDPETRAQMLIAYADIAYARQEYPRARAQYDRVAVAKEFAGTYGAKRAELKIAEVDRLTHHFDAAFDRLDKLDRQRDSAIQTEARFQMALLRFDQEDFAGAREAINRVFAISPNHAQAALLEGELNVRTKKLVEATDLKIGLSADQQTLIPGRPLRVGLEDRTLGVVGKTTDVEIRVWTDSGDEEIFMLLPFGDSKTKFRGEIATVLALTKKGDRILQVLGRDKVHYGFSDRFRKAAGVSVAETVTVEVITDAELYASSGRILTREEQEEKALEQLIRQREQIVEEQTEPLSTIRSADEVKPGNPIYVRVIDPDRSTTPQANTITVRANASSGDVVEKVILTETGTHTGIFEGKLPTASASATAFASDTEEGRQANHVIAADTTLPPWVALGDKNRHKAFTVDLNSNIALGKLSLLADVTGRALKRFAVQTSMNGSDYTTIATWPEPLLAWDGTLRMRIVRYSDGRPNLRTIKHYKDYFSRGHLADNDTIKIMPGKVADDLRQTIRTVEREIALQSGTAKGSWALAHLQGTFYVSERRKRVFKIDPKNRLQNVDYLLAVDGVAGSSPLELSVSLAKGYHTIDLYAAVHAQTQAAYELLWDIEEAPYTERVPAAIFTPDAWSKQEEQPTFFTPAVLTTNAACTRFDIAFDTNTTARLVRFDILDFESDAPAIRKIELTDAAGAKILPAAEDVLSLRQNQILEIVPGDRITLAYEDPSFINSARQNIEVFLQATFYNAEIGAFFVETMVDPSDNLRRPLFVPMRRYQAGEPVTVFIQDPDEDKTDERDKITFRVRTTADKEIKLPAIESDKHSGMFVSRFFPVAGEPKRASELTVADVDDITIVYRDELNTDYGIPWERTYTLEQAGAATSALRVFEYESRLLTSNELEVIAAKQPTVAVGEVIPATRTLNAVRPNSPNPERPATTLLGAPLIIELRNPALAISPLSEADLFVQTSTARKHAGVSEEAPFNPSVPGTIRYRMAITEMTAPPPPEGYQRISLIGDPFAMKPIEDGRFSFVIPTVLGTVADMDTTTTVADGLTTTGADEFVRTITVSCLTDKGEPRSISRRYRLPPLHLRPDDVIRVAVNTAAPKAPPQWVTQDVILSSDVAFDVMDQRYQKTVAAIHVGERLYLRIIDPMADLTADKDKISVSLLVNNTAESAKPLELMETFEHTGVFKGSVQIEYEGVKNDNPMPDTIAVPYGATITLRYSAPQGDPVERIVAIRKGADGEVLPFTKRFQDTGIAVQTQFTTAEAYFEMAKKYRALKEEEVARRTIAQGKKILEEAIRDFPKTDARVQADYLLANLALESAEQTDNEDLRRTLFVEAITRFSDLIAGYPESEYAPKGQFKKALVFERMGEIDMACEEYVKLSYRYPENELVAETIARLGQYFMTKGKAMEEKIAAASDVVQKEKARLQANEFYKTAAQVFARLSERFPEHSLAAKTKVLSAENWLRGQELQKAVNVYEAIIAEKKAPPELLAQAMYWCGDSYIRLKDYVSAYRMLKRLTWDYPESVWAKYARGRLTESQLAKVELEEMKD